mmetsp:Transcript_3168/g.7704  ORF Transcript_3168/g.7704 Transcript_3168/m.7704 type:complete len:223 (+) Transcript_3168:131-799(+)
MFCGPRRRAAAGPPPPRFRPLSQSHRGAAETAPCARRRAPPARPPRGASAPGWPLRDSPGTARAAPCGAARCGRARRRRRPRGAPAPRCAQSPRPAAAGGKSTGRARPPAPPPVPPPGPRARRAGAAFAPRLLLILARRRRCWPPCARGPWPGRRLGTRARPRRPRPGRSCLSCPLLCITAFDWRGRGVGARPVGAGGKRPRYDRVGVTEANCVAAGGLGCL